MEIRKLLPSDWSMVRHIYERGIATGYATFETEAPSWKDWDASHLPECRIVAGLQGKVVGWAALSPVSDRCVYGGVAEVSIYIDPRHQRKGIGRKLLASLVTASENEGYWTLQCGIFPENNGSIMLHRRAGFREIGKRERIGKLHGVWKDNIFMERRSRVVGV